MQKLLDIFDFLMNSGVRIGEGRALKCKDVNLAKGSISISSTLSGNVLHRRPKTRHDLKAKPYEIEILPEWMPFLRQRVEKDFPEQFVFLNPRNGRPYSIQALRKIWDKQKP